MENFKIGDVVSAETEGLEENEMVIDGNEDVEFHYSELQDEVFEHIQKKKNITGIVISKPVPVKRSRMCGNDESFVCDVEFKYKKHTFVIPIYVDEMKLI